MSPVRVPRCPDRCQSACTALSRWAAGNRWLPRGPRSQCRQPGLRIPHDLQPPPAVQKTGTPVRWVAGVGSPADPHPNKPSLFSPSRLPPFPPKNDVRGCRRVTDPSCEGDPRPEAGQPRRIYCSGPSEALRRRSDSWGRPGIADRMEVPSWGREQYPPHTSPTIPAPARRDPPAFPPLSGEFTSCAGRCQTLRQQFRERLDKVWVKERFNANNAFVAYIDKHITGILEPAAHATVTWPLRS